MKYFFSLFLFSYSLNLSASEITLSHSRTSSSSSLLEAQMPTIAVSNKELALYYCKKGLTKLPGSDCLCAPIMTTFGGATSITIGALSFCGTGPTLFIVGGSVLLSYSALTFTGNYLSAPKNPRQSALIEIN